MEATLLLADAAQGSPDGKVHALGIGWQHTSAPTPPTAVVVILHVPWAETNRKFKWELDLLDGDGKPVLVPTSPTSLTKIHMEQEIEVGRPPGIKAGTSINVPLALTVGPMPLRPGATFEWVLSVGDRKWRLPFWTRPVAPQGQPPTAPQ